jgi:tyrosinase
MTPVIRKAAWSSTTPANGWSDELRWYAAAIHQMKLLTPGLDQYRPLALRANDLVAIRNRTPAQNQELRQILAALAPMIQQWSDPRSLGYQAQVHATYLLDPADWPQHLGQTVLWHECAHGNWFFLPWHRAYLVEFEAVVRAHIEALGGPHQTWALPYWNSSDYRSRPEAATLPLPLRDATVPDGVDIPGLVGGPGEPRPNPLHEPSRDGPRPLVGPPRFTDWPDASQALRRLHFANAEDSDLVSFGGGYLEDLTFFHSSSELGQMDLQPHGQGHVETGGFMASFFTAGLDPVFWMHHANVDRLWETYANDLQHGYPFADGRPAGGVAAQAFDSWSEREFRFLRADGSTASWTAPKVLDVEALGYRYDTITRPQFNPIPALPFGGDIDPFGLDQPSFTPLAAASGVGLAEAATIVLTGGAEGEDLATAADSDQRWNVRFDGLRCERPALTSYAVYLDLDDDQTPDESRLLGALSLFGVFESSIERNGDLGSNRLMDATAVVGGLPDFDPLAARLTLIPTREDRDLAAMGLTVERISLEVG